MLDSPHPRSMLATKPFIRRRRPHRDRTVRSRKMRSPEFNLTEPFGHELLTKAVPTNGALQGTEAPHQSRYYFTAPGITSALRTS
jgi:hypothetical protein